MKATLALENGIWYEGEAAGAPGETSGEVVFNTSMTGYQEILTDPSYVGQIVTMTVPEVGNYGIADEDGESRGTQVAGFIVREESPIASNWRSDMTLREYLTRNNVVAISDIDTRALTRVLRSSGVMRGVIATGDVDPRELVEKARAVPSMEGSDLVLGVTCEEPFDYVPSPSDEFAPVPERRAGRPLRIAAYDFGMKYNILRRFAAHGCDVRVYPATTPAAGTAGVESRRRVPQQRSRRSGRAGLRDQQRAGADEGGCPGLRHLPRPPDPVAGHGRRNLQAEVRSSRRQSPGQGSRDRQGRDHLAEPRLRRRRQVAAAPT